MRTLIRSHARRAGVILATVALIGATVGTQVATAQSPGDTGHYSGAGQASLIDLDVASADAIPGGQLLDARLAPTRQAANTEDGLSADGIDGSELTAYGEGTNVKSQLAGNDLLSDILVEAEQTAPPPNEEQAANEILEIPENPLLAATVARAEARANDVGQDACPDESFLASRGYSEVADAQVLPGAIPDVPAAVSVGETVSSETTTSLVQVEGRDNRAVQSQSVADLTSLQLFGQVDVQVSSPPTLTATAGAGDQSGVSYNDPTVTINGTELVDELNVQLGPDGVADLPSELDPLEQALQPLVDGLEMVFQELGVLALRIEKTGVTGQDVAGDGTSVSADASLLQVQLLAVQDQFELLSLDVAPMHAEATAPADGVECGEPDPITVEKTAVEGEDSVQAGDTFTHEITVTNDNQCTLTDVTVEDETTGPAGTEVTETSPTADEIEGLTVTWNDQGPIEPGESQSYTVTVQLPEEVEAGATLEDTATATATCGDDEISGDDTLQGPSVAVGAADVAAEGEQMPRTGGGAALAAIGLLLGGLMLRRRG